MSSKYTVVETSLNRAEFRWKWLRFLQHSLTLASLICLLVLAFGGAVVAGWVTSKPSALTFLASLAAIGFVVWMVIIISVAAGTPDRNRLAAALERADRRLLDRLNTLLFLEPKRSHPHATSFAKRIAKQTQRVVAEKAPEPAFSARRPLAHLAVFIAVLAGTILMFLHYTPWARLVAAEKSAPVASASPEKPLELALPAANNVEQNQSWGEVRITDPGADLKVTKVDVVPLQIEAAANQALREVNWVSAINGKDETPHQLEPPKEPRYAVYQPTVYLDELNLSDWDVMTYYARANTESDHSFASQLYFLEVRPFREDILKMPGGENGTPYQCLNELSGLINRQQHIIRQTHQHIQKPPDSEDMQAQDRNKLSEAENELGDSARHLYAEMASKLENKPIGEALDNLAKAEKSLGNAGSLLKNNNMKEAPPRERGALAELVAARKAFQKGISDNPNAFDEAQPDEAAPVADSSKKLNEMAEFRNESKAAQDFVRKTLAQQKALEKVLGMQTRGTQRNGYPALARQEQELQKSLEDFQQQHPKSFQGVGKESQETSQSLAKAAQSLESKSADAPKLTKKASEDLEKFSDAMQNRSAEQQLADAYRLKEMLDRQIQTFDQRAKTNSTISDSELQKTANEARQTINELKKDAEQNPTRDAFGQPLRDSLAGSNKVNLDAKLNQLLQAQDEAGKEQLSGEARDGLSKVSKAFAQSAPRSLQMAKQNDSLKPNGQESFDTGMAELKSLANQAENNRQVSRANQAKQGREALYNLQNGMRSLYGNNERGKQILIELDEMLKSGAPLEVENLKRLMDELQHFSVETSDALAKKDDKPEVNNIDSTRLPPAYRGRIQKYFQKLSEK